MSRQVSIGAIRAMVAQETDEAFLACLTISHPTFASSYLLVCNNEPIERDAGEFEPFAFQLNLPNESEDQIPQVAMTIDNVDRKILKAIRNLPPGERVSLSLEWVLASSPNTVEVGPLDFKYLSIDWDMAQISGTLGFDDDLLNTAFPRQQYTPVNSPGVFA